MKSFINSQNQDLYQEVLKNTEIELVEYYKWGCRVNNGKAHLYFSNSANPYACFTHELLHIKYHYLGLQYPKQANNEEVNYIIPFLFNQLSHHKFYNEYINLGFEKEHFLSEIGEDEAKQQIENEKNKLQILFEKNGTLEGSLDLLALYISLKSPHDNSTLTLNYIEELKTIVEKNFFSAIDSILEHWVESASYNPCYTLAKIFKTCNMYNVGFYLNEEDDIIYSANV